MRTLAAALTTAQKAPHGVPYVKVETYDRVADITRLRWTQTFSQAEPDDTHAAVADSTYLHRARISGGNVQYERNAGSGWTTMSILSANVLAIAAVNNARVIIVYNAGAQIRFIESTDQGENWGSDTLILTAAATPTALAVAYKNAAGDLAIVYEENNALRRVRRTGGTFGSPATWTRTMNSINGVAMAYNGDFPIAVTGTDTDSRAVVATTVLGDGLLFPLDSWSALLFLAEAETASNVTFKAPSLAKLDTHRLAFVESYSGSTAYDRPYLTWHPPAQGFDANAWREPVPFNLNSPKGVALTGNSSTAYLSRPDAVWSDALASPANDLTDDVLEVDLRLRRFDGRARVVLRNDDARYAVPENKGISKAAQLEVSLGYYTTSGNQSSTVPHFWIDRYEHHTSGGRAVLVILASDAWGLLRAWRARRQHHWDKGQLTIATILSFLFGRAAVELLNVSPSTTAQNHKPRFTVHPGEDGVQAARRLLAMVSDYIEPVDSHATLTKPDPAGAASYAYGTDHAIYSGRFASENLDHNRAQVFGAGELSEAFDWDEIADRFDRLRQVFDLNLDAPSETAQRASDTLRQEDLALNLGELVTPPNCGQELEDIVAITDPNANLNATKFRVQGIDLTFRRHGPAKYEQRLLLGGL